MNQRLRTVQHSNRLLHDIIPQLQKELICQQAIMLQLEEDIATIEEDCLQKKILVQGLQEQLEALQLLWRQVELELQQLSLRQEQAEQMLIERKLQIIQRQDQIEEIRRMASLRQRVEKERGQSVRLQLQKLQLMERVLKLEQLIQNNMQRTTKKNYSKE